ncbi:hypothetical protein TRIATDRAFT_288813 [Trichoderma atroviride IMI 206040]|uniref:Uncharacterized protein n=1 Tax=Hypocrea atroviridis (strain ATCC 20476 / IMI 206040) TaxID=452589 RepID=G9NF45_HYPAI|nr:uncharacterized protein TRIATDRAFT_254294 [Trichoderma atroviride IMI 206040]EHK50563.1 hypothetical protein TRIATDRAFT_288813 [Trichoderma atroviride IMI 206040]
MARVRGKRKLGWRALMLVPRFIKDPEIRTSASFHSIVSKQQHRVIIQPYLATLCNNAIQPATHSIIDDI